MYCEACVQASFFGDPQLLHGAVEVTGEVDVERS
jgi:hypothetical protein